MDDTKKIFGVFLIVLFIIIVIGVTLSRVAQQRKGDPILGGALERALFPERPVNQTTATAKKNKVTPTITPIKKDKSNVVVIKKTSQNTQPVNQQKGETTPTETPQVQKGEDQASSQNTSDTTVYETKGAIPQSIPATGAPTVLSLLSLSGLAAGVYLKKRQ